MSARSRGAAGSSTPGAPLDSRQLADRPKAAALGPAGPKQQRDKQRDGDDVIEGHAGPPPACGWFQGPPGADNHHVDNTTVSIGLYGGHDTPSVA